MTRKIYEHLLGLYNGTYTWYAIYEATFENEVYQFDTCHDYRPEGDILLESDEQARAAFRRLSPTIDLEITEEVTC